jgi:hypothetical protein
VEPRQHDAVIWNKGSRSNRCNKQDEAWGTGILYTNSGFPHQTGFLQANTTDKDKATPEYAEFLRNRETLVTATVISDFLILQTSSGDQPVIYFQKDSNAVGTETDYATVPLTKAEAWDNNSNSASEWSPQHINIGSYNGNFSNPSTKYRGTGNGSRVTTIFDNDPAGTVNRTARPSAPLHVARNNITIRRELPNNRYETGMASAIWQNILNHNPDNVRVQYNLPQHRVNAPYSDEHSKVNDIVVHNPVSAEYAMILSLDTERDQRSNADKSRGGFLANVLASAFRCPGTPEGCEFRVLNCRYAGTDYHTVNCFTAATPHTFNAHYHSVGCIDHARMNQAVVPGCGWPGCMSCGFAGDAWGLVDLAEIVSPGGGYTVTTQWLSKQPFNSTIFRCNELPHNIHVCNASCSHTSVLRCNEPHHTGGHYGLGGLNSWVCWEACGDDHNHRQRSGGAPGSVAEGHIAGGFLNLDWGFQIYYPNIGDFWQGGAHGIPQLTAQRGRGFIDGMDTTEWVRSKRVMFGFDVIYCGTSVQLNVNGSQHGNSQCGSDNHRHTTSCTFHRAGTWINLNRNFELYNFYLPASVNEGSTLEVTFESVAINAPGENDNALPANRLRDTSLQARHGAMKTAYTDVTGRIGNLVMSDTGDYRFSNLFKLPLYPEEWLIENIVREVDIASKHWVIAEETDIRGLSIRPPHRQDTYGLSPWLAYNLLPFSLSPDKNNLSAFRREPIRAGYPLYMSIDTIGRGVRSVSIIPYYYWFDTDSGEVIPLDVYMDGNLPVNLYGQPDAVSAHPLALRWESEYLRRNVSENENDRTRSLGGVFPSGNYNSIGSAQSITLDERCRTFVGSQNTLNFNQNRGVGSSIEFDRAVKRWHFTIGLPSSMYVVDVGADPSSQEAREKYRRRNGAILMTAEIFSVSDSGFTLEHSMPGGGNFTIGNNTYALPPGLPSVIAVFDGRFTSKDDWTVTRTH